MGTVQVFTADRMLAIENSSIVDGSVVGDNLILEQNDGTPIDAGNVRGPQGSQGIQGVQGTPGLDAAFVVRATATSANITQSGTQTIDGVALAVGDRVLCKSQTTASQNGIWVVAAGAWTRATDADTSAEIAGAMVRVQAGTLNGGTRWVTSFKSTDTIGTTSMVWERAADGLNMVLVSFSGTTDSTGFLTVTHSLGWTPRAIFPINQNPNSNFPVCWGVDSITSTTCRIRFLNASSAGGANTLATGPQMMLCIR
jgi:hypothetical protein